MPRYPGGDYYLPPGTEAAPDTTIESTRYNVFTADVETEFNNMSDIIDSALNDPVTGLPTKVSKAGDTMTGPLVLPAAAPTLPEHATNKSYVDTADALKVAKAGDTMTGHLTLPTGPAAANAVRKDYVDAADTTLASNITSGDALKVAKAGDTMTGVLNTVGVTMGSVVAPGGATDLSKHLSVYGGSYGLSITSGTMNAVAGGSVGLQVTPGAITTPFATLTNGWDATCVNSTVNYGANSGIRIMGSSDAFMSFHRLSGFAANFGLGNDNNLRFGGWSHGGNYWKVWTERDTGWPLSNGRLPYAGDQALGWPSSPYTESVAHALLSGGTASNSGFGNMVTGFRYRLVQGFTSGWFTFAYA